MSAGTLTLTNNSAQVSGAGTSFTTELTAGDFIVVTVGGVPYTLPVKTIESNTGLTLVSNFTGPTQSGAAWSAVPRVALNMVTAALVAQSAEALRGLNYDKQNWQQFFTADGDVTITLPDTSQTTGPSAKKLINSVVNKADKINGVVPKEQGGTGLSQPFGDKAGQFCQGDDSRLNSVNGKSGGEITSTVSVLGGVTARVRSENEPSNGTVLSGDSVLSTHTIANVDRAVMGMIARYTWGQPTSSGEINVGLLGAQGQWVIGATYTFNGNGSATAPGSWVPNSDGRLKFDIERISDPLEKMVKLRGVTWQRLDGMAPGIGFIAQEVQKVFPEFVFEGGDRTLDDGTVVEKVLSPDTYGVAAALHHEAILALMDQIEDLKTKVAELQPGS
ncbi:tail fiber domain-containing protein [Salmonella enterica]|nr:tail fiber domain-containing protein [Salmonella enterica]